MASIPAEVVPKLQARLDEYTSKENGIPGLVYTIINKDGDVLFNHASGKRGAGIDQPMTIHAVFWLASCTKMITAIAAMQLVESKRLALDDVDQIEEIVPELKQVEVLEEAACGSLKLVEKKRGITLRMLLAHTAGFGYSFLNPKLKKWSEPIGLLELSCNPHDLFKTPLVNQPGEVWEYGTNIDWVGLIVERVSGLSLDAYFQKFIFTPLGIKDISFFPSEAMKKNLAFMHQRGMDSKVALRQDGHPYRRPLINNSPEEIKMIVHSGGGGCFGDNQGYCEIIATLLNNGTHKKTGAQILQPGTVDEMFTNQIPQFPNFARDGKPKPKPSYANDSEEIYPQPHDQAQGWGLSFFYLEHPSATGRSAGSGWWAGLPNLIWWADRKRGIGGLISTQILPFGDLEVFTCQAEIEHMVYAALDANQASLSGKQATTDEIKAAVDGKQATTDGKQPTTSGIEAAVDGDQAAVVPTADGNQSSLNGIQVAVEIAVSENQPTLDASQNAGGRRDAKEIVKRFKSLRLKGILGRKKVT